MAKVITVANQKGGVGKTTTTVNLATVLARRGYKTLVLDATAEHHTSTQFSANGKNSLSLYDVLCEGHDLTEAIVKTEYCDIVTGHPRMASADVFLTTDNDYFRLKDKIDAIDDKYDFIIIDTRPDTNMIVYNCMSASDELIIPVGTNRSDLEGFIFLFNTIRNVKRFYNPSMQIGGVLRVMYNARTIAARKTEEVLEEITKELDCKKYKTIIPYTKQVDNSSWDLKPVVAYAPSSKISKQYNNFADEVLDDCLERQSQK